MAKTKEEQMKRVLEYSDFNLQQFKTTGEGAKISYWVGGLEPKKINEDCDYLPHPDLTEKLGELQLYFASRIGILKGWDFARDHLRKDSKALEAAMEEHKANVERCKISGISFSGESSEDLKVKITGSYKTPDGGAIGMATPAILLENDKLGYEEDVKEICEEIKKEVYAYLFQHKKFQLDIESEAEKAEKQYSITDESENAEIV